MKERKRASNTPLWNHIRIRYIRIRYIGIMGHRVIFEGEEVASSRRGKENQKTEGHSVGGRGSGFSGGRACEDAGEDDEGGGGGVEEDAVPLNLLLAKQRNGPTGDVELTFLKSYTRFESKAKVSDEDVPN